MFRGDLLTDKMEKNAAAHVRLTHSSASGDLRWVIFVLIVMTNDLFFLKGKSKTNNCKTLLIDILKHVACQALLCLITELCAP